MAPRAPPPRRTQLPSWVSPALQAALRRGAVAVHVAFAAAGFHALGYGLVGWTGKDRDLDSPTWYH